jgi:hypothetical protein
VVSGVRDYLKIVFNIVPYLNCCFHYVCFFC